jgi:hypothetical protein
MLCTVESHEKCKEINRALLGGKTCRAVSREFGVSWQVIRRHRSKCLPWRSPKAKQPETVEEKMADLNLELKRLQFLAEAGESVREALAVVRQRQSLLELEARAGGLLDPTHKKLMLANKPPTGKFTAVFDGGRPRMVAVEE